MCKADSSRYYRFVLCTFGIQSENKKKRVALYTNDFLLHKKLGKLRRISLPRPIRDPGLTCAPQLVVRARDEKRGAESPTVAEGTEKQRSAPQSACGPRLGDHTRIDLTYGTLPKSVA
jgi:hypothetical protein